VAKKSRARPPRPARRVAVGSGIMEEGPLERSDSTGLAPVSGAGGLLSGGDSANAPMEVQKRAQMRRIERM